MLSFAAVYERESLLDSRWLETRKSPPSTMLGPAGDLIRWYRDSKGAHSRCFLLACKALNFSPPLSSMRINFSFCRTPYACKTKLPSLSLRTHNFPGNVYADTISSLTQCSSYSSPSSFSINFQFYVWHWVDFVLYMYSAVFFHSVYGIFKSYVVIKFK